MPRRVHNSLPVAVSYPETLPNDDPVDPAPLTAATSTPPTATGPGRNWPGRDQRRPPVPRSATARLPPPRTIASPPSPMGVTVPVTPCRDSGSVQRTAPVGASSETSRAPGLAWPTSAATVPRPPHSP